MAHLTSFQLILPYQLNTSIGIGTVLRHDNWQRRVADFGLISGIAALCSAVAFPVAGALSDRTTSRFGRRRPWIVADPSCSRPRLPYWPGSTRRPG